jgi:pimeloyl-ACP methyl ester carboxylesterase
MGFENNMVNQQESDALVEDEQYESSEGHQVELSWSKFIPDQESLEKGAEGAEDSATIFLPGWSMEQTSRASAEVSQALANKSRSRSLSVNTSMEVKDMGDDPMNEQAEVVLQFIKEQGIKELTLLGYSQGGDKAIDLAAMLKDDPDIDLKGVVLVDSTGLYEQNKDKLPGDFVRSALVDTTNSVLKQLYRANYSKRQRMAMLGRGVSALVDILGSVAKNIVKQKFDYKTKLDKEVADMAEMNTRLAEITAPVVIISGDKDPIANPDSIVPPEEEERIVAELEQDESSEEFVDPREKFLQETMLPNSPYVRMIVGKKMGHHSLPFFRPESIANVGLYALERYHRRAAKDAK